MDPVQQMREAIKRYIETADEKVVKMVHALLEADDEADWWTSMPEDIRQQLSISMHQADQEDVIDHDTIKARFPQWFTK